MHRRSALLLLAALVSSVWPDGGGGCCPSRVAIEQQCCDSRHAGNVGNCLVCIMTWFPGCNEAEM